VCVSRMVNNTICSGCIYGGGTGGNISGTECGVMINEKMRTSEDRSS